MAPTYTDDTPEMPAKSAVHPQSIGSPSAVHGQSFKQPIPVGQRKDMMDKIIEEFSEAIAKLPPEEFQRFYRAMFDEALVRYNRRQEELDPVKVEETFPSLEPKSDTLKAFAERNNIPVTTIRKSTYSKVGV